MENKFKNPIRYFGKIGFLEIFPKQHLMWGINQWGDYFKILIIPAYKKCEAELEILNFKQYFLLHKTISS